jgi:hypothetical protein
MTNREIIQLLKKLRWYSFTAPDGMVRECQCCGVGHMPGYEPAPRHKQDCKVEQAIRSLNRKLGVKRLRQDRERRRGEVRNVVGRARNRMKQARKK